MSLQRLSQRLELDVSHLMWQAKVYGLDHDQVCDRFDKLATTYISLVNPEQCGELEALLRKQIQRISN